jgi:hypothetical protein
MPVGRDENVIRLHVTVYDMHGMQRLEAKELRDESVSDTKRTMRAEELPIPQPII